MVSYGYEGRLANYLDSLGVEVGDKVRVRKRNVVIDGILMPAEAIDDSRNIIVLKLSNGYKIGILFDDETEVELLEKKKERNAVERATKLARKEGLPRVSFLSTGGTIVSKVDYETGAVRPALSVEDLLEWIPELGDVAYIDAREVLNIFSENIEPKHWELVANEVYREMINGVDGVVVAHGTDMMAYTASAMAFAVRNKPVPIVFVGSQRSSDRPSTDSVYNLKSAFITAVKAPFSESVIVMHGSVNDSFSYAHRAVKCRKMHTSRRDAFQSINDKPLAIVYPDRGEVVVVNRVYEHRDKNKQPILENKFEEKIVMIKAYPGVDPELIDFVVDKGYRGIVIEGSGLGHISEKVIGSIKRATESGVAVVMTSQCIFGRVNLNVYSTGRLLLKAGVIPASDTLPEVAFVKLSWILGSKSRDLRVVAELMNTNTVGEINPRHTLDLFPKWV